MPAPDWLWSLNLGPAVRAIALAREAELILARLDDETLALVTTRGDLQARTRLPGLVATFISDDGSTILAAAGAKLLRLQRDLRPLGEQTLPAAVVAVAADPFGRRLAASDRQGNLHLFDTNGRALARVQSPRPGHHLAFVPTQLRLIAAADLGWVGCLDLDAQQWAWSDRPVSNIGSLAVAEEGEAVLACFSDGLRRYDPDGQRSTQPTPAPCGLVALSFTGARAIAAGIAPQLYGFDTHGALSFTCELAALPTGLTLAALGDRAFLGHSDGRLLALGLPKHQDR